MGNRGGLIADRLGMGYGGRVEGRTRRHEAIFPFASRANPYPLNPNPPCPKTGKRLIPEGIPFNVFHRLECHRRMGDLRSMRAWKSGVAISDLCEF